MGGYFNGTGVPVQIFVQDAVDWPSNSSPLAVRLNRLLPYKTGMILIGQYDSPFVRRVGIALTLYGIPSSTVRGRPSAMPTRFGPTTR